MRITRNLLPLFAVLLICFPFILETSASGAAERENQSLESRLKELATKLTGNLPGEKDYSIALLDFSDLDGNVTNLGRYLAEELTTQLFTLKKYQIVERRMINTIMQEQKLSMAGLVSDESYKNFGNLLGVDILTTGSIADFGSSVKVNARMISPASGEVLAVASIDLPNDNKVKILLGKTITPEPSIVAAAEAVPEEYIGIWKLQEESKEFYYEIKKNGFVFYCELDGGEVADLDTGTINGGLISYSEGTSDRLSEIGEEYEQITELPQLCR